jgi:hypothetical protein
MCTDKEDAEKTEKTQEFIPQTIEEGIGIVRLKIEQYAKDHTEEDVCCAAHFSSGMWIRNNWGLWKQDSCIYKELVALGLWHADDMSSLIITCAVRDLKGKDRDIPGIVQKFKDYWAKQKTHG